MNLPKIPLDDAVLFGSLFLAAAGLGLVVAGLTQPILAIGAFLVAFGVPATVIAFLAAGESK